MSAKVLIIEDEPNIRETIVDTLEFAGYEVATAENGTEGIALALSYQPDLILCDIMMPNGDGYDVLEALSKGPKTLAVPFIFLTAKATKADQRNGMIKGADDYLTKPFRAQELLEAVQARLEKFASIKEKNRSEIESIRDYFHSTIPHELRTPLSGIVGFLELLEEGIEHYDTEAIRNMLTYMRSAANRLDSTVDNFIAYSQLQIINADDDLQQKIYEFSKAKEASLLIRQIAEREGFDAERPGDLEVELDPADLFIYQEHLTKLAKMLINNGFKFSDPGTPVRVTGRVDGENYHLSIENEGRGFTSEQIAKIGAFTQFERDYYEQQGTGMGLAIAKTTLDIYSGGLEIESCPEETTTVTATLKRLKLEDFPTSGVQG